ncbi:MAG TPA: DUF6364 family protein [Salinimicrobium sp.]|nr:DUF6364 family protein [Salinimicrobium sp.]
MSTVEIKKELHKLIDAGDDEFLRHFYEVAIAFLVQTDRDQSEEGGDDKKALRTYSDKEENNKIVSPLVESLTGVLEGDPDYKKEYREYLKKKYL